LRPYQVATAAVLILIAAVAMFDTRAGALPDATGGAPGGLKGGWYPFWSGALIVLAGAFVAYQALATPQPAEGVFRDRAGVFAVGRLIVPMIIATYLMSDGLLGFYLASGLYMAYFARFTSGYRWVWALAAGIIVPIAIYLAFEIGFRAIFPKSFLYLAGILPF
jgi:putative tricarboxylic transport membrane protein